jgi:hypothetical protein
MLEELGHLVILGGVGRSRRSRHDCRSDGCGRNERRGVQRYLCDDR